MLVNTQNSSVRRFAASLLGLAMSGCSLFVVRFCQSVSREDKGPVFTKCIRGEEGGFPIPVWGIYQYVAYTKQGLPSWIGEY